MSETILTNAALVLEGEIVRGTIAFGEKGIRSLDPGSTSRPSAIDVGGDLVAPGLVEMHTDNPEKHFVPRPNVIWPNGLAATLAHDAQMAAAGVTTVYDSICAGTITGEKDYRRKIFPHVIEAVGEGVREGVFRIDHKIHIRCELTSPTLIEDLEPHVAHPLVQLVSLMDHTPGHRQYRNVDLLKRYYMSADNMSEADADRRLSQLSEEGPGYLARNMPRVLELCRTRAIPVASHDDTTLEDIALAVEIGAVISEFPTTAEAASAAKARGLATVAGAPNVVRGGSHSSNVSAAELAEQGHLDGLSSDYVPASLLQAVIRLEREHGITLPAAMGMVTWRIADMVGLSDRGRLAEGLRGDVLRFRVVGDTPVVTGLWSAGRRAL